MKLTVRLFAGLREAVGQPELEVDVVDGATVGDVISQLREGPLGDAPFAVARNQRYARADEVVAPSDELALIPPVSGG